MALKAPKQPTNCYTIIKSFTSIYYALTTQKIRFINEQVYDKKNARIVDNDPEAQGGVILELSK